MACHACSPWRIQEAEEARHTLLELQAVAAAVESSGQTKAEAQARAERLLIEGQSAIECEIQNAHLHVYNLCIYQSSCNTYICTCMLMCTKCALIQESCSVLFS